MNIKAQPKTARLLVSMGLLIVTLPMLFKEYVPIPDFARGFLLGIGLVMELTGVVLIVRNKKNITSC